MMILTGNRHLDGFILAYMDYQLHIDLSVELPEEHIEELNWFDIEDTSPITDRRIPLAFFEEYDGSDWPTSFIRQLIMREIRSILA